VLSRLSFRRLLLLALLLIAGLLAAASFNGLYMLERLLAQSQDEADRAALEAAEGQRLEERGVAMERAARQFLVLGDASLLQRHDQAKDEAQRSLHTLALHGLDAALVNRWNQQMAAIGRQLGSSTRQHGLNGEDIVGSFQSLHEINAEVSLAMRQASQARNAALQDAIDAGRSALRRQMLAGISLAVGLALALALWLARPLKRLERAIVQLGENRLNEPVAVQGPSDLRALGTRLDWLRLRLKELDDDKSRFLRHISHELKTPLAALREGVAILEEGVTGPLNPDQREVARILGHNVQTLQAQIEDLLRFNAAAFEARKLVRRPTDLRDLIEQQISAQQLQWQAKRIEVTVQGDAPPPAIDADKLGTALGNLLSNAIRFTPNGGHIRFELGHAPGQVVLDLFDDGPGVAASDVDRVFEPFYRGEVQPEGAVRGTGIGLSIVREYIDAHGGRVSLLPHPSPAPTNRGAHFRIELPHAPV